jgi:hypothetical protein
VPGSKIQQVTAGLLVLYQEILTLQFHRADKNPLIVFLPERADMYVEYLCEPERFSAHISCYNPGCFAISFCRVRNVALDDRVHMWRRQSLGENGSRDEKRAGKHSKRIAK